MGKHSGKDSEKLQGPHGPGPHPTREESERAAREFERSWSQNKKRAEEK